LLVDEANTNTDVLYALAPLFRGEKRFTVEFAGESYAVEVDDEALVLLTLNPLEDYSGRDPIGRPLLEGGVKGWMSNPDLYDPKEIFSILRAQHDRKIGLKQRALMRELDALEASAKPFFRPPPAVADITPHALHAVSITAQKPMERVAVAEKEEAKGAPEEARPPLGTDHFDLKDFDRARIEEALARLAASSADFERIQLFAEEIMPAYFLALSNREGADLNQKVLEAAVTVAGILAQGGAAPPIAQWIQDIQQEYQFHCRKVGTTIRRGGHSPDC
ncbi:MAG: hypothetical protein HY870_04855, partial [Chloroflexi bacterium]|nr:hypothetical protein [Chloroflexota bacterium]